MKKKDSGLVLFNDHKRYGSFTYDKDKVYEIIGKDFVLRWVRRGCTELVKHDGEIHPDPRFVNLEEAAKKAEEEAAKKAEEEAAKKAEEEAAKKAEEEAAKKAEEEAAKKVAKSDALKDKVEESENKVDNKEEKKPSKRGRKPKNK